MQKATCPEGAEDRGGLTQARIGISGCKSANREEEQFRTLLKNAAWHSMNDTCEADSPAAPAGQVVTGNRYQGLKPLAESCHPFGIGPTDPSRRGGSNMAGSAATFLHEPLFAKTG